MNGGYYSLPRVYDGHKRRWHGRWFMFVAHLHAMAQWAPKEVVFAGETVVLKPGQLMTQYRTLAKQTGLAVNTVRKYLSDMEDERLLTRKITRRGQIITMLRFVHPRLSDTNSDTNSDTLIDTLIDTPTDTIQELKELEELKERRRRNARAREEKEEILTHERRGSNEADDFPGFVFELAADFDGEVDDVFASWKDCLSYYKEKLRFVRRHHFRRWLRREANEGLVRFEKKNYAGGGGGRDDLPIGPADNEEAMIAWLKQQDS